MNSVNNFDADSRYNVHATETIENV